MRTLTLISLTALLVTLTGCRHEISSQRTVEGVIWNTSYHIKYNAPVDLTDSIARVMHHVEMSLSPFQPSSIISRVNRGEDAVADTLLQLVFAESKRVNTLSDGAFDPTLAPLINMWGFGYTDAETLPDDAAVDSCLRLVGIDSCHISPDGHILKKNPGTTFNFSAITKGFACDEIGRMMQRNGVNDFLIEIGGEIKAGGLNLAGQKWSIMVDAPLDTIPGATPGVTVIHISDCGVATSGNYRNRRNTPDGQTLWHTISPVTGHPYHTNTLSATVIAPTAMTADALATACMAMTAANALAMIERSGPDVAALLITASDTDSTATNLLYSSRWHDLTADIDTP